MSNSFTRWQWWSRLEQLVCGWVKVKNQLPNSLYLTNALNIVEWTNISLHDIHVEWHLGLQVLLKYAHQVSFIQFLYPNKWKSDWTNNECASLSYQVTRCMFTSNQAVDAWTAPCLLTHLLIYSLNYNVDTLSQWSIVNCIGFIEIKSVGRFLLLGWNVTLEFFFF